MKRAFAAFLCAVIMISCFSTGAFAEKREDNPTVLISGFMCSQLYLNYGKDNQERVWGINVSRIADRIMDNFSEFMSAIAGIALGEAERFGETIGDGAEYVLEPLKCNDDGESIYPVEHYPNKPATSNIEYMLSHNNGENLYEKSFCTYLSGQTDPSRVFCFQYDSRLDALTLANELRAFIKEVKAYTGADKINLFALSYGGLISSTYMSLFADEGDVDNLVMSAPALGGTNIPARLLRGEISLADENLISFAETALDGESNFARLFEKSRAKWVNRVLVGASGGVAKVVKNWGSLWSLCSAELYDDLKAEFLDPVLNAELIEKSDFIHYEIMPNLSETFERCREQGISISILCGTGSGLAAGGDLNADIILPAYAVSGATCAPLGQRFANGYTGIKTACDDPNHYHISPSMEIDASSAYLPENTWFIDGQYHGQYYYEEYTRSLVTKLLFTDDIKDIYSDSAYPQFEYSNHSYRTLHAKFNKSAAGYLSSEDSSLIIDNLCEESYIIILSIVSNGVELNFNTSGSGFLAPGKSIAIPFSGDLPQGGPIAAKITVNYIKIGSLNPFCTMDFDITVNNSKGSGGAGKFVSADFKSRFEEAVPEKIYDMLVRFSLRQCVECLYNSVTEAFR